MQKTSTALASPAQERRGLMAPRWLKLLGVKVWGALDESIRPTTRHAGQAQSGRLIAGFGGTILEKLRRKMLKALINAPLSSGFNKPLELRWISPLPVLLLRCACFFHMATQL
jgi:hypothetical protein